jgi:hypothetical protein
MTEIYCDCDGVLNFLPPKMHRILKKLPVPISGILFFITGYPNKKIIRILRRFRKKGHKIIIITSRPKFLKKRLEKWLFKNKIPYNQLICTGPFRRKLKKKEIVADRKISIGIDDEVNFWKGIISVFSPDNPFLDKLGAQGSLK